MGTQDTFRWNRPGQSLIKGGLRKVWTDAEKPEVLVQYPRAGRGRLPKLRQGGCAKVLPVWQELWPRAKGGDKCPTALLSRDLPAPCPLCVPLAKLNQKSEGKRGHPCSSCRPASWAVERNSNPWGQREKV